MKIGDKVEKHSGYKYPGEIRAIFTNRAGKVRYVVEALHEDFEGMLHIFNGDQLIAEGDVTSTPLIGIKDES